MSSAAKVRIITAGKADSGQRIDNYLLRELSGVPKPHIYKIIRTGQVRVNKKRIKPLYKINPSDQIRIPPIMLPDKTKLKPRVKFLESIKKSIIYENKQVLVINKPAGLAVHGGSGIKIGLIEAVRSLYPKYADIELVHRLDKATSGCLIISKNRAYLRFLHDAFRNSQVHKTYLALLAGRFKANIVRCSKPLKKNILKSGERIVEVEEGGKAALTVFKTIQKYKNASLVKVELMTGRTHQIRVHAQSLGHPVLGDDKYGNPDINENFKKLGLRRMFLHANKIIFPHPKSDDITVRAPVEQGLYEVLNMLVASS